MSTNDYELVQDYFENNGVECWECPHFSNWTEPHGERLSECKLLVENTPFLCPALDDLIAKAELLTEPTERSEEDHASNIEDNEGRPNYQRNHGRED